MAGLTRLINAGQSEIFIEGGLILPHPRITLRRFVLAPLAEIRPTLRLPRGTETIAELLKKLPPGDSAELFAAAW